MQNTYRFMAILCALSIIALPACVNATNNGSGASANFTLKNTSETDDTPVAETVSEKSDAQPQVYTERKVAAQTPMEPIADTVATTSDGPDKNSSSYKIIAGDILQVTVWKEEGLDQETLVLPGGMINFPLVGSMNVQGETPAQVQEEIKQKLHKFIPDAAVTVSVKAALGHTVSVIGQVTKPGEFVMGRHMTVMQALSQAGGLTPYASEGSIIILRHDEDGKETSIPFPYDDVSGGSHLEKDIVLLPGDVVVVPTAGLL